MLPENSALSAAEPSRPICPLRHSALDDIFTNGDSLDEFLAYQVEYFIGKTEAQLGTAQRYFRTIHSWIQFIHKPSFLEQFYVNPGHLNGDFSFLLLCMNLLSTEPSNTRIRPEALPLYVSVKAIIPAMELRSTITLQNVQARLLICLYEVGHMIQPSLFLSISSTARCAIAIGCDRRIKPTSHTTGNWFLLEEERRVWWTIYILDW